MAVIKNNNFFNRITLMAHLSTGLYRMFRYVQKDNEKVSNVDTGIDKKNICLPSYRIKSIKLLSKNNGEREKKKLCFACSRWSSKTFRNKFNITVHLALCMRPDPCYPMSGGFKPGPSIIPAVCRVNNWCVLVYNTRLHKSWRPLIPGWMMIS